MDESKQPGLRIQQIVLSAVQFEHRQDMLDFPPNTVVELEVTVSVAVLTTEDELKGLVRVMVETNNEKDPLYRFKVEIVGLVEATENPPNFPVRTYLEKNGPPMLYPFLREAVANITGRGRFGAVWLNPLNLKAMDTTERSTTEQT